MVVDEKECFVFVWQVKNFSMFAGKLNRYINSPIIQVRKFGYSEWILVLNGKGNTGGFLSCFLQCRSPGIYKSIRIEFTLSVVTGSLEEKYTSENKFCKNSIFGYNNFILKESVLKDKCKYLPKDTLTIKCSMQCQNISDLINADVENLGAILGNCTLSENNSLNINNCCIETVIPLHTSSFLWPIRKYLLNSENKTRITRSVFSAMKGAPTFNVTIVKSPGSNFHIEIENRCDKPKILKVKCIVSATNSPKGIDYSSEHQFLYKSEDDKWNFSPFFRLSKLEQDGYFELNEDVLYLKFDFIFSIDGEVQHAEKQQYWDHLILPLPENQFPPEPFVTDSKDDDLIIVTLRAGDRTFSVDGALLKAKSEVFNAMFNAHMKERDTCIVDIPDVDPETLERMIFFLYFGIVGNLPPSDAKSLYVAANKYMVRSLLYYCSSNLISSLTVSNACDILEFADFYQDDRLLKTVEHFIFANTDRMLMSKGWKYLMQDNPSLAANIMYKILTK